MSEASVAERPPRGSARAVGTGPATPPAKPCPPAGLEAARGPRPFCVLVSDAAAERHGSAICAGLVSVPAEGAPTDAPGAEVVFLPQTRRPFGVMDVVEWSAMLRELGLADPSWRDQGLGYERSRRIRSIWSR